MELEDAIQQDDKILAACELSDLMGAIKHLAYKYCHLTLEDLIKFNEKTEEAFKEGKR